MADRLDERKWLVLRAAIRDHILTALPVGSEKLTKRYRLNLSPATVRNIMASLEESGYLEQPHVSSGRVPTDLAFRAYVDSLMDPQPLHRNIREFIVNRYQDVFHDVGEIMQETSRILSRTSRYAGIVSAPNMSQVVFEGIDLFRLDDSRILIVLISTMGVLFHRVIEGVRDLSKKELSQAAEELNHHIKGRSLSEARHRILEQIESEKNQVRRILDRLWNTRTWLLETEQTGLYIDGQSKLLDYPEFAEDIQKMKALLRAFEEKEMLFQLVDKVMEEEGIRVYIGSESEWNEMADCSLIMSSYYKGGTPLGTLGIIGPKRMDYSRVIPLVEFAAKAVGEKLETMGAWRGRD